MTFDWNTTSRTKRAVRSNLAVGPERAWRAPHETEARPDLRDEQTDEDDDEQRQDRG